MPSRGYSSWPGRAVLSFPAAVSLHSAALLFYPVPWEISARIGQFALTRQWCYSILGPGSALTLRRVAYHHSARPTQSTDICLFPTQGASYEKHQQSPASELARCILDATLRVGLPAVSGTRCPERLGGGGDIQK
jgi:hypothetical protein